MKRGTARAWWHQKPPGQDKANFSQSPWVQQGLVNCGFRVHRVQNLDSECLLFKLQFVVTGETGVHSIALCSQLCSSACLHGC